MCSRLHGNETLWYLRNLYEHSSQSFAVHGRGRNSISATAAAWDLSGVSGAFTNQVIRADDLAQGRGVCCRPENKKHGGPIFENRDIGAVVESLHTHE
jgi:hypothetical protein